MGRRRALDVALLIWAAVRVWVGICVAREVRGVAELSETGRRAVESARASERNARRVGTLLGVSITLIPILPLLILYVAQRIALERELRDAGDRAPADAELERLGVRRER